MAPSAPLILEGVEIEPDKQADWEFPSGGVSCVLCPAEETRLQILMLMGGIASPAKGAVFLLSHDTAEMRDETLGRMLGSVGILERSGGLINNLSVFENVSLPLYYHSGLSDNEIDERVARALEQVGYRGDTRALPSALSVGWRRALGLARILAQNPDVAVVDSLLSGLSVTRRGQLAGVMRQLSQGPQGAAVVYLAEGEDEAVDLECPIRYRV